MLQKHVIATLSPELTLPSVVDWFNQQNICALGIAAFGPLDINKASDTYGFITTTPKKGWQNFNLIGYLRKNLNNGGNLPIGFQTDVNAAALAENKTKDHLSKKCCVYITVGGGIGVGVSYKGSAFEGLSHGEGGHIRTARFSKNGKIDDFKGVCPFHGDCVEGMCCVKALSERSNTPPEKLELLADNHEIWVLLINYTDYRKINFIRMSLVFIWESFARQ